MPVRMSSPEFSTQAARHFIMDRFAANAIPVSNIDIRAYPDELIFIVYVQQADFGRAAELGNELDGNLQSRGVKGFVTVRPIKDESVTVTGTMKLGVHDERATTLVRLLRARSRVSEVQPSVGYVPDAAATIQVVTTPRHHLIFGRRGAGKTALMAEAKRRLEDQGALTVWVNVQTHRRDSPRTIFLWTLNQLCILISVYYSDQGAPAVRGMAAELSERINTLMVDSEPAADQVDRLIPLMQQLLRRFGESSGKPIYVFLDDFYYMRREDQPAVLDMIHGCVRDTDVWLKIASIRHLTRWFQASPPMGLQTTHDADHIDLDVTLQDPSKAKAFLEKVLQQYAANASIGSLTTVFSAGALDRLVLASGVVPRDYLNLGASSIAQAQERINAKLVGVQDVNQAAGNAAAVKISELEDDMASDAGLAQLTVNGLQQVRAFCLEEKRYTYFRVDFKDKEQHAYGYDVLTSLLDVRLVHLVNPSVSDLRHAGERSEVFMLDLSQFSGSRLKKFIRVLDFVGGHLVAKQTGTRDATRVGDTPRRLIGLLRTAPELRLSEFEAAVR
jgi:hypothetical protein